MRDILKRQDKNMLKFEDREIWKTVLQIRASIGGKIFVRDNFQGLIHSNYL